MPSKKNTNGLVLALETSTLRIECCKEVHTYDPILDDLTSVVCDSCEVLARSSGIRFVVMFDDDPWSVDVHTDLAVILEQLPAAVRALKTSRSATIDFYEQGVQRQLEFSGEGGLVEARCGSAHPNWEAPGTVLQLERGPTVTMLTELGNDFHHLLRQACPELAAHEWIREWRAALDAEE